MVVLLYEKLVSPRCKGFAKVPRLCCCLRLKQSLALVGTDP